MFVNDFETVFIFIMFLCVILDIVHLNTACCVSCEAIHLQVSLYKSVVSVVNNYWNHIFLVPFNEMHT